MNILIPHHWLLEYLDTTATPEEIQKYLSLCGPSIERIYEREGDQVYDIEITTNRVDSMSILGIAREAAVILKRFGKKSTLKTVKLPKPAQPTFKLPLPKILDDHHLTKRIMCVVLADVQRNSTPEWMANRLRQIDGNIHDAVIDITNYITHELGHPCHAFDYDKVMELGGIIEITTAKPGKKFVTLDGVEHTTVGGEIVFENGDGVIIDFPGIMGTANTSVNQSTKNILFWLENIEAKKIRFASMTHAIRTVAAQLNEKNVDPNLAEPVLNRGVQLFADLTNAKIASQVYDQFPSRKELAAVTVPLTLIQAYLGLELPVNEMASILEDLGCEVRLQGESKVKNGPTQSPALIVTPPSFRPDIEIPADVIEEIARIYGYHNLPSVLMPTAIPLTKPHDVHFEMEGKIKQFLAAIGWQEVFTYSMVSAELAKQSGHQLADHLKIQNPLSDDREYLRRTLVPSLVEALQHNPTFPQLQVFELAKIYLPQAGELPTEPQVLAMVSPRPYREVKGSLESLYQQFFVANLGVTPAENSSSAVISAIDEHGQTHEQGTISALPSGLTAISLDLQQFAKVINSHPIYQPLAKTSVIVEDLTFTLPPKVYVGELISAIKAAFPLVSQMTLQTIYEQNYSFTLSYHQPDKNLTAEEVQPIRKNMVQLVKKQFGGVLVGTLE